MKKGKPRMLTVKEVAKRIGAGASSVRLWVKEGKFPGARQEETDIGSYWLIPETALEGFEVKGRGRPPKPKEPTKKSRKK